MKKLGILIEDILIKLRIKTKSMPVSGESFNRGTGKGVLWPVQSNPRQYDRNGCGMWVFCQAV